jgi:Family of unknown function (DUF6502)
MNSRRRRRKTIINSDQAVSLLYPIAAFLSSGGMDKTQSLAAFAVALDHVARSGGKRALEHIGTSTCYLDLIATWSRERRFLDSQGRPRPLALSGANGFAALVKSTGARQDPKELLGVLMRYRNVRRMRDGRVQLVSPLFRASAGSRIAFEPIAHFLSDATSTLTHILKNASTSTSRGLFWRKVASTKVSAVNAGKFMEFAKERSLLFLDELEDWLRANGRSNARSSNKKMRVGLGLFTICSHGTQLT